MEEGLSLGAVQALSNSCIPNFGYPVVAMQEKMAGGHLQLPNKGD